MDLFKNLENLGEQGKNIRLLVLWTGCPRCSGPVLGPPVLHLPAWSLEFYKTPPCPSELRAFDGCVCGLVYLFFFSMAVGAERKQRQNRQKRTKRKKRQKRQHKKKEEEKEEGEEKEAAEEEGGGGKGRRGRGRRHRGRWRIRRV